MCATQTQPNDPPPQEDPTHDVPVYPEKDPPPGQETAIQGQAASKKEEEPEPRHADPAQPEDVDEDDLDPKVPHSPPDAGKGKIVFDENKVPS
jgi:hypothetical protein